MQVKIEDARLFYEDKLKFYTRRKIELEHMYAEAKTVYESRFFPKLFGWKYENSAAGDRSWLAGNWDFVETQWRIEDVRTLYATTQYHSGTHIEVADAYGFLKFKRLL